MTIPRRRALAGIAAATAAVLAAPREAAAGIFCRARARRACRPRACVPRAPAACTPGTVRKPVCQETITGTGFDTSKSFVHGTSYTLRIAGTNFSRNPVQLDEANALIRWSTPVLTGNCSSTQLEFTSTPMGAACSTGGLTVTVVTGAVAGSCIPASRIYRDITYT